MTDKEQRIRVNINSLIDDQIVKLNRLFKQGAKNAKKDFTPFTKDNYDILQKSIDFFGVFAVPYFLTYTIRDNLQYRYDNPCPGKVWYWNKDADMSVTKDFLPLQVKLLRDTLDGYVLLLKSDNHLQALILFRSYIEYSSQLYASLLDYDFFLKYTGHGLVDEEYKKLWFSNLKPAKVLDKINKIHTEVNALLKNKKIVYSKNAVYRREFQPFDSKLRGFLYGKLSALAHGSHRSLANTDETNLYSLAWLCTCYLVESQAVIDELMSVYFSYTPEELFKKWVSIEIYKNSMERNTQIFYTSPE